MRHYETIYIISPELPDEDIAAVVDKFRAIIEDGGGTMVKVEDWGRRRLAYEVKKFHKGYYVLFDYGATPAAVAEMERNFKIDERVIRYLTVLLDEEFDAEALIPEPEPEEPAEETEAAKETPAAAEPEAAEEAPAEPEAKPEPESAGDEKPTEDQPTEQE